MELHEDIPDLASDKLPSDKCLEQLLTAFAENQYAIGLPGIFLKSVDAARNKPSDKALLFLLFLGGNVEGLSFSTTSSYSI